MTLGRRSLKRGNSPLKSPKLTNSSLRRNTLIKRLSQEVQFGNASKANLKVVVRIRPENEKEVANNARSVIDIVDDHMLVFDPNHDDDDFFFRGTKQKLRDLNKRQHKEQKFIFENVFGPVSTNEEIFEKTTKDLVATLLNGYNCSVFAYGATGAGKTYTMLGKPDSPGIAFLTVMELYQRIQEVESSRSCEVGVSYLEIYNESVRDLLASGKPLNLHESGKQVQVSGLSLHKPKDASDLMQLLADGNRNRTQHPTDSNAESSRSHAVFQVFLRQQDRSPGVVSGVSIAKLSMIDLAGSERGAATGFKGARFREGANINRSLLALGNCINALADGKCHIPYRDSKLTRLLKDSLGGNCRSVMIAAISKASTSYEDSFNTLRYAHRAKTIKTTLKKNLVNVDHHVSQYLKIVEELRAEVAFLNEKIKTLEAEAAASNIKEKEESLQGAVGLTDDDRAMYEETILKLQLQLESKNTKENQENSEEKQLLNRFQDMHCQLKGYQRERLQLEANERELKYKIYSHQLQLTRMTIFASVSERLNKAITKVERSVKNFTTRLEHVQKRKEFLASHLESCRTSIRSLCESLRQFGHTKDQFSESARNLIETNDLQLSVRDSCQASDFLQGMLKDCLNAQVDSDKLNLLLLYGFKYFYVKLRSVSHSDFESDQLFQNVLSILDSNRIEWADQKRTEDSFGEGIVSQYISHPASIDPEEIVSLPLTSDYSFSPVINDFNKVYRRSIMKGSGATASTRTKIKDQCLSPVKEDAVDPVLPSPVKGEAEKSTSPSLDSPRSPQSCTQPFAKPLAVPKAGIKFSHSECPPLEAVVSPQLENAQLSNLASNSAFSLVSEVHGATRLLSSKEEPRVPLASLPLQARLDSNKAVPTKVLDQTFELEPGPDSKSATQPAESTFCIEDGANTADGTFCLSSGSDMPSHLEYIPSPATPLTFMAPPVQVPKASSKQNVASFRTPAKSMKTIRPLPSSQRKSLKKSVSVPSLHSGNLKGSNNFPSKAPAFGSSLKRTTSSFRMKNFGTKNQENVPPRKGPLFSSLEKKMKRSNQSCSSLKDSPLSTLLEPSQ